jgi:leucyl-tRNA synthetase
VLNHIYLRHTSEGRRVYLNPADVEVRTDASGVRTGAASLIDGGAVEYAGLGTMSKSRNNGVDPQTLVEKYGADTARLFMMFAAPPEQSLEWSDEGVQGQFRFLRRLWKAVHDHVSAGGVNADGAGAAPILHPGGGLPVSALPPVARELRHRAHQTIVRVTSDIGRRRTFNTAIAAVMELLNAVGAQGGEAEEMRAVRQEALQIAVLLLSPIVPHICHVLWQALGHHTAVVDEPWPHADPAALAQDTVELVVQVNGKLRGRVSLPAGAERQVALDAALAEGGVQRFVEGREIRKVVHVPDKLINLVI